MRARVKRDTDWQDPIVAEVRAAREALFAAAGYDIREFVDAPARLRPIPGTPS